MSTPDWAPFLTDAEWREFERVVRAQAGSRGLRGEISTGMLHQGGKRFGLVNLAQGCRGEPLERWPALVAQHFDVIETEPGEGEPKVRLIDEARLADLGDNRVTRRVAEDLHLVLCWDYADRVGTPTRDQVLAHGDADTLFATGLRNARAEPDLQVSRHEVDGVPVVLLHGDSFFTATHALWADALDPPPSEHGTLVAVPSRHAVLAHAIRDRSALGVLGSLLGLARRLEQDGPGSISPHLYWLCDGQLERLEARTTDRGVNFEPSEAFARMLTRLS